MHLSGFGNNGGEESLIYLNAIQADILKSLARGLKASHHRDNSAFSNPKISESILDHLLALGEIFYQIMESFTHDPQRYTNRHDLIVARSRALHRAVAKKIRSNPDLMKIVSDNLNRWLDQDRKMGMVSRGLLEWKEILESHKVEEILDLICEESETADRLRHATPFCGVLTEDERNAIFREYASSPA